MSGLGGPKLVLHGEAEFEDLEKRIEELCQIPHVDFPDTVAVSPEHLKALLLQQLEIIKRQNARISSLETRLDSLRSDFRFKHGRY